MKSHSNIQMISIIMMLTAICIISFGFYKIYSARIRYENSIKTWDTEKYKSIKNIDIEDKTKDEKKPKVYNKDIKEGDVIGKIIISKTKEQIPIIEGTSNKDLDKGAGHYLISSLPGMEGNSIIFGHRDGAFLGLKKIIIGDEIIIESEIGNLVYKVYDTKVVEPEDEYITKNNKKCEITLVTCYPFYFVGSAPKRFVVKAELLALKQ